MSQSQNRKLKRDITVASGVGSGIEAGEGQSPIWAILYGVLGIGILVAIGYFVYRHVKGTPAPPPCNVPGMDPTCSYVLEKYQDPTLKAPTQPLYLTNFEYIPEQGAPWCVPTWYAFRYVRVSDGGYSTLSEWTHLPVQAGASMFPCPDGKCWFKTASGGAPLSGTETCHFNAPVIGTIGPLDYDITQGVYANVHRQHGALDPSSEGEIVGFLIPSGYTNPAEWQAHNVMTDILFSNIQQSAECKGC